MDRQPNPLIEQMTAQLQPVRPIRLRDGLLLLALASLFTVLGVELIEGVWRDAWTGGASAFFVVTNGLLLVLGIASASSVLRMASPRVGNHHDGPRWAMVMVAVLPLAALVTFMGANNPLAALAHHHGLSCFGAGLAASVLTAAVLGYWLRRGAPVSVASAGLHLGVAATALGSAAWGLACTLDDVVHLGFWHVLPLAVGSLVGRYLLPPLLRW